MLDPSSALTVHISVLQLLDTSANALDKLGRAGGSSQDVIDVERAAQFLKDVGTKEDTSNTRPPGKSELEIRLTEPEKAIQSVYERVKKFADRLVLGLQSSKRMNTSSSTKSGDGAKKDKGETEKLQKEVETIRLESARNLIQLLSMLGPESTSW